MSGKAPDPIAREVRGAFERIGASDDRRARARAAVLVRMRDAEGRQAPEAPEPADRAPVAAFRRRRPVRRVLLPVAACLLATVLLAGGWAWTQPVAAIAFDVNPSLELGVNRFDRVVGVEAYNQAGEQLAREVDVRFEPYEEALDELLGSATVEQLVQEGNEVSITVATSDDGAAERLMAGVERCSGDHPATSCHRATEEEMESAHHEGLSVGRWRAYRQLLEDGVDITAEEANGMTMRELREMHDDASCEHGTHQNGYQSTDMPGGAAAAGTQGGDAAGRGPAQGAAQGNETRGTHERRHQGDGGSQEHS